MLDAECAEQFLVVPACILELGRSGYDRNAGRPTTANFDKAVQDFRVVQFFLGATDRDDEAALSSASVIRWTHYCVVSLRSALRARPKWTTSLSQPTSWGLSFVAIVTPTLLESTHMDSLPPRRQLRVRKCFSELG